MNKTSPNNYNYIRSFLYLFFILTIIWLILTSSFHWQELATGIILIFFLSLFLHKYYLKLGLPALTLKKIVYFIFYIFVLLVEIIKANFDVAYRVLHPRLPIKPGIVIIRTNLKQDIAKTMLANSITLTPGTFTLDIKEDQLLIHWIYVRSEDPEKASMIIGEKFEKYLRVVFA